jgi:hypothetical protein
MRPPLAALAVLLPLQAAAFRATHVPFFGGRDAGPPRRAGPLRPGGVLAVSASLGEELAAGRGKRVVVLGGGLAGLAVSYHLLNLTATVDAAGARRSPLRISIFDQAEVGQGGASGAMAGLLHPLTPRGKKIWLGDEGFASRYRCAARAWL